MRKVIGGFAAGVVAVMAVLAAAEDRKPADPVKPPEEVWLEGEVIDLTSYLKDGSCGKDHWKMAKAHIKAGTPAALRTFDGKLYVITPYNNEGFEPLQRGGEQVRMKAMVYERDGVKCAVAKDVKKLPPDYKPGDDGGDRGHNGGGGGGAKMGGK
ncbi:MAG: hypothetical protein FD180_1455 [Planctomycetota bacterium]|nr:MAG: hypothetical protein FD180_1455 [Planctomycetota bacterium]